MFKVIAVGMVQTRTEDVNEACLYALDLSERAATSVCVRDAYDNVVAVYRNGDFLQSNLNDSAQKRIRRQQVNAQW